MGKNRRHRLLAVIVILTAFSGVFFGGPIAHAEQAPEAADTVSPDVTDVAVLQPLDSQVTTLDFSPAGCVGKSNNPHKDTYGHIKGVTQIDCLYSVPKLRTTAQLWRKRWWGYEKVGTKGDNTNYNTWQVKASGIFYGCQNNWWRTEGEHWSWEGGKTYYAHTMKYAEVTTC